ncbi:RNA polymerase sigma-70 factor (ECF subfamily) [Azomonas agilis]|uniref:RNA polymerase sigma-70 factor (ECF subfamily) n=1 Tax=Azomonas agilis TaxID=116849 RepID=A0A562IYU7_9GAMM|nr:sigma-70 family RNA polymerase sigma factor [Azomonas agilis]TWH76033.1 RNA polymerase sigma-70 factor (ECF subfamily) [Azomonas agilis]
MENYYREIIRYLTAKLGDGHLAADVTQDAFLRILERSSSREDIIQPRAFLYRTALNLVTDEHRRSRHRCREDLNVLDGEEGIQVPSPQHVLLQKERLALLQRALAELSEPCRQAFVLRKLEGLGHVEIAQHLGISKDMVEKHIVNAMKHCRIRMRQWDAGQP